MKKKAVAIKLRKFSELDRALGNHGMLCFQCLCHVCYKTEKSTLCNCYFRRSQFDWHDKRWKDICAVYHVSECIAYKPEGGDKDAE